ncbi:hypothetical protein B566_EDAN012415 [Ephemera danica]|nr:hypothetical protein B566_EDAN012415 [Ephemera danica]
MPPFLPSLHQVGLQGGIAKPVASRPSAPHHAAAFDSHLQSFLASCRHPYLTGLNCVTVTTPAVSSAGPGSTPGAPPVFPLAGSFPWAGSARGKPRRGMMRRAVFSDLQRKGLERRFQMQKYISKPDRKKLAEKLGLKDSQESSAGDGFKNYGPAKTLCAAH